MDIVKKRLGSTKSLVDSSLPTVEEDSFEHLNLLSTIKLPKNLANLTKDLPKSNYISNRGESASSGGPSTSLGSPSAAKLLGQVRLQSEPGLVNSRQLPSVYSMPQTNKNLIGEGGVLKGASLSDDGYKVS